MESGMVNDKTESSMVHNPVLQLVLPPRYYGKGSITNDNYVQFIRHDTLGFEYIEQSQNFVAQVN